MSHLSREHIQLAFHIWLNQVDFPKKTDQKLQPFLTSEILPFREGDSWLREAREASQISLNQAAQKIDMSRAAFAAFEKREMEGTISLRTLAQAAAALDCELVYAIRPRKRTSFSERIWNAIWPAAKQHHWVTSRPANKKGHALAARACRLFEDSEFRQNQGWSERKRRAGF